MAKNKVTIIFDGENRELKKSMEESGTWVDNFESKHEESFGGMAMTLGKYTIAITAVVTAGKKLLDTVSDLALYADEQERAFRSLENSVRAVGEAADLSADQMARLAAARQGTTTFGDEATFRGQAVLTRFGLAENQNTFIRATDAAQDLAAVMNTDIVAASRKIGESLQDPIRAIESLREGTITFSKAQQEQIRNLVEMGRIESARMIVLERIETLIGQEAETLRDSYAGSIEAFNNSVGDLKETMGSPFRNWLAEGVTNLGESVDALNWALQGMPESMPVPEVDRSGRLSPEEARAEMRRRRELWEEQYREQQKRGAVEAARVRREEEAWMARRDAIYATLDPMFAFRKGMEEINEFIGPGKQTAQNTAVRNELIRQLKEEIFGEARRKEREEKERTTAREALTGLEKRRAQIERQLAALQEERTSGFQAVFESPEQMYRRIVQSAASDKPEVRAIEKQTTELKKKLDEVTKAIKEQESIARMR